jgi:hypothetical protein
MSEDVLFKFTFSSQWFREAPKIKIYINETLLDDVSVTAAHDDEAKNIFEYKIKLNPGENTLKLEYYNKSNITDTKIDEDGNILDDHIFRIEDIEIDEISLGFFKEKNGLFYPLDAEERKLPKAIPGLVNIGYNGTYELKFSVPTYIWFLETI